MDKRVTEDMARAAESEAARVREGILDPKDLAYIDHEARPLADHIPLPTICPPEGTELVGTSRRLAGSLTQGRDRPRSC